MITETSFQESLSAFALNPETFRKRLTEKDEAIALTTDGRPELVVLSVRAFQELVDRATENLDDDDDEFREWTWDELSEVERQRILAQAKDPEHRAFLRQSLADAEAGNVLPAKDALEFLRIKYGIPRLS